jgi:acyl-CoA synthetase (NDP forming)
MQKPPSEGLGALAPALLAPSSIAIVGQSDDAKKTTGRPLRLLRQAGFAGRAYPVNARRQTVLGERAWPTLAALPETPEHVYVVTAADAAVEAVEDAGRLGVAVATVLADGFAEAGEAGAARVARLRAIAAQTGIRIVGPSSLGVVNLRAKMLLTANAAFLRRTRAAGRTRVCGLPQRQHDRGAPLARQGARARLCGSGLGRQRGRSFAWRDLLRHARRSGNP